MTAATFRWANAERAAVLRSDGAFIPADPSNRDFAALDLETVEPFQRWADIEAARAELLAEIEAKAAGLRSYVAGTTDASKLAVYREKATVAEAYLANAAAAQAKYSFELAALSAEAAARGESLATLAALVVALAGAWRAAGLAIDAAYQGHKAAIQGLASTAEAEAYDLSLGWPPLS